MDREFLTEYLTSAGYENSLLFDCPSYDDAIIGISDGQVCYSFTKMIESLKKDNMSEEDAIDFIYYNTIRALDYQPSDTRPIIVYDDFF